MKRLILWTLALIILTTTLTGGVVAYARTQGENPLKAMGFDVCDGKPCFMGIVPGVTTWSEIEKIIGIKSKVMDSRRILKGQLNSLELDIESDSETEIFPDIISIFPISSNLPTPGAFLNFYGRPCGIVQLGADITTAVDIDYPFFTTTVAADGTDRLNLSQTVIAVTIVQQRIDDCPSAHGKWVGFTRYDRYWDP